MGICSVCRGNGYVRYYPLVSFLDSEPEIRQCSTCRSAGEVIDSGEGTVSNKLGGHADGLA